MASTPYRAVSWEPLDLVGDDKMDQLANNIQYVYENTPRIKYTTPEGIRRFEGIKIASGRVVIPKKPKSDAASIAVRFGNFFSPGCEPNVTTGLNLPVHIPVTVSFRGFEGTGLIPDHNGFQINVKVNESKKDKDNISRSFLVHWSAQGY